MAEMNLQFIGTNSTNQGWDFALYQKQPKEPGLQNMAWKVLALSAPQPNPTQGNILWSLQFQVTIPQKQIDGTYILGGLTVNAKVGYNYEAYMKDGFVQIKETGQGADGYIKFVNKTTVRRDLGLGLSGTLLSMQQNVDRGVSAQFQIHPTYYLGLFANIKQGSFVTSDAEVGPIPIEFPPGMNTASVEAFFDSSGAVVLSTPKYSHP